MRRNFKLLHHLVMYCHVKIMQSSYKHLKYLPDIYNLSTQKQAPFTVTPPRHDEALVQNFISTSETLAQIGM